MCFLLFRSINLSITNHASVIMRANRTIAVNATIKSPKYVMSGSSFHDSYYIFLLSLISAGCRQRSFIQTIMIIAQLIKNNLISAMSVYPLSEIVKVRRVFMYDHALKLRVLFVTELCSLKVTVFASLMEDAVFTVFHRRDAALHAVVLVRFGAHAVNTRNTKVVTARCIFLHLSSDPFLNTIFSFLPFTDISS